MKLFKKVTGFVLCLLTLSVVSVSAIEYACQTQQQTGVGYVNASCHDTLLKAHAYYDSSSERYHVNMYLGPTADPYAWRAGVNAGQRNGDIQKDVGQLWNNYGHKHQYSKNII